MSRPIDKARREQLLRDALGYLSDYGLAGLSLRPLASALGTSDRMLIHYFGSKENLVGLALSLARPNVTALLAAMPADVDGGPLTVRKAAGRLWLELTSDAPQRTRTRLLLEVMALALTQPVTYGPYAAAAVEDWVAPVAAALLVEQDRTELEARAIATVLVSGLRGLALDRYITNDAERTNRAAALLITSAEGRHQ